MLRAAVKNLSMYLLLWPASDASESPAPDAAKGKGSKSDRDIAWRAAVVVVMAVAGSNFPFLHKERFLRAVEDRRANPLLIDASLPHNFDKLHEVQYKGGILRCVDSLQCLNQKVRLRGLAWRKALKRGLPERIIDRLAEMMRGEPVKDDALIVAIKEIGRSQKKRQEKK